MFPMKKDKGMSESIDPARGKIYSSSARIIFLMMLLTTAASTAFASTAGLTQSTGTAVQLSKDDWAALNSGGILKWLKEIKGTEVKEGIAIGIVDAPPQKVWKVVHENNDFVSFMPRTLDSVLVDPGCIAQAKAMKLDYDTGDPKQLIAFLKKHRVDAFTGTTCYFFSRVDVPWPATNRWYLLKLDDTVTPGRWYESWSLILGNLKSNDGSWDLRPLDNDRTLVTYKVFSDPGGMIPDWIINIGTNQTLPEVIKAVRKRVKEEAGAATH